MPAAPRDLLAHAVTGESIAFADTIQCVSPRLSALRRASVRLGAAVTVRGAGLR